MRVNAHWWASIRTPRFGFDGGIMLVSMRMHRTFRSPEKPSRFVRREVRNDLPARDEFIANSFEVMRVHDGRHHLAVDGERHIHHVVLDQRRPVLVAHRMAQFDAGPHRHFRRSARQIVQMHDHYVAQVNSRNDSRGRLTVPDATRRRRGYACRDRAKSQRSVPFAVVLAEATFLRLPLIDLQEVYRGSRQPLASIRDRRHCPE